MSNALDILNRYKGPVGRALLSQAGPGLMKGVMIEYFKNLDIRTVATYINNDTELWSMITPQYRERVRNLLRGIDISWLSPDWLILAIREDYPAIASLFILPGPGRDWLDKQIHLIHITLTTP